MGFSPVIVFVVFSVANNVMCTCKTKLTISRHACPRANPLTSPTRVRPTTDRRLRLRSRSKTKILRSQRVSEAKARDEGSNSKCVYSFYSRPSHLFPCAELLVDLKEQWLRVDSDCSGIMDRGELETAVWKADSPENTEANQPKALPPNVSS